MSKAEVSSRWAPEPKPTTTTLQILATLTARVCTLGVFILTFVWVFSYLGGMDWVGGRNFFNGHPFFMLLGVSVFLANGVLSWRDVGRVLGHTPTKAIHAGFNLVGGTCIALGLFVTIKAHTGPHFMSLHSWIALASAAMLALQLLGGLGFFSLPICPLATRVRALPLHAWLGVVSFLSLTAVVLSGMIQFAAFRSSGERSYNTSQTNILMDILGALIFVGAGCTAWALIPRRVPAVEADESAQQAGVLRADEEESRAAMQKGSYGTPTSRASTAVDTPRYAQAAPYTNPFGAEPVPARRNVTPPATAPAVERETF